MASVPSYSFRVTEEVPDLLAAGILSRLNLNIGDLPVEESEDTIFAKLDCIKDPPTRSADNTEEEALEYRL